VKIHRHFIVAIVILAVAAGAMELYYRYLVDLGVGKAVPLAQELKTIPKTLGRWTGQDVEMDPYIRIKTGAQDLLRRNYYRGKEEPVQLYVAYFGGVRGTAPHHPDVCMPGQGWRRAANEIVTVKVPGFGGEPLRVHKDIFEKESMRQMVIWWEYVHGKNVASRLMQRLQWALPSFLGGKRGSVLQVQILLTVESSSEAAWDRAIYFMDDLGPYIKRVLPREEPSRGNPKSETRNPIQQDRENPIRQTARFGTGNSGLSFGFGFGSGFEFRV
jgi:EpsI family protein